MKNRLWQGVWILLACLAMFGCDEKGTKHEFFFHENGGSPVEGFWVVRNQWDGTLPASYRSGYVFEGWYLEPELETLATKETVQGYHVDLYAKWSVSERDVLMEYYVEWEEGEYSLFRSEFIGGTNGEALHAFPIGLPGFTEKTDHPDRIESVTLVQGEAAVLRLYYQRNTYRLTLNIAEGYDPLVLEFQTLDPLVLPDASVEEDYMTFDGWCFDAACMNAFDLTEMPPMSFGIYAKWILREVTVTFDSMGGPPIEPMHDEALHEISFPNPTRYGYHFFGWYTDPELTTPYPNVGVMPTEDTTLYAYWVGNDVTITIQHWFEDPNGNFNLRLTTYDVGKIGRLAAGTPLQEDGYRFVNNHPDQVLTGRPDVDQPVTLKLYYVRDTYRLIVEHGFGDGQSIVEVRFMDQYYSVLPRIERPGYTLRGFKFESNLWVSQSDMMPPHDVTVRMVWDLAYVTLSFVTDADPLAPLTQAYLSEYDLPTPSRVGYEFAGWYWDEALSQEAPMTGTMPNHNATLYAKWSPILVTVTFETNGAGAIDPIEVLYDSSYALPSPEKEGFLFGGWYRDPGLTEKFVQTPQMADLSLTLYAKWLNLTYMIHFDTMGGDYVQDLFQAPGTPIVLPVPERFGFDFVGWFDASLTTPFTGTVMPEENLVLYAKWQPKA
jgi:uncharacterized repeat protein (TIGR02543 family)